MWVLFISDYVIRQVMSADRVYVRNLLSDRFQSISGFVYIGAF